MLALGLPGQVSDTEPPTLKSLAISPVAIDVSASSIDVTVVARVTDNLAGVSYVCATFFSPARQQYNSNCGFRISGTPLDGTYSVTVSFPRYSEAGVWTLDSFYAGDITGNNLYLDGSGLQGLGFPTSLVVTSAAADTEPPKVASIAFSTPSINTSSGPQNLVLTLRLTDNLSGVDLSRLFTTTLILASPTGQQHQYVPYTELQLTSGNSLNGVYQVTHAFPQHSEAGTWSIIQVQLVDNAGNYAFLFGTDLQAPGLANQFTVIDSQPDFSPPQLVSLSFSPLVIDTSAGSQSVTVTMGITDNLAGADFSYDNYNFYGVEFSSPSRLQYRYATFFTLAGPATNGTWTGTAFFPQYSEVGSWAARIALKDSPSNRTELSTSQLQARGLPFEVTVFRPSTVPDGTVGPAGGTIVDNTFQNRATITVPPGTVPAGTTVAIDVLTNPPFVPTPRGFSTGSFFVNFTFTPSPTFPLPPPGLTVVMPMPTQLNPGTALTLYRFDPAMGALVPAVSVTGSNVVGVVDATGLKATFSGISHLSTLVAFAPNSHVLGDVNGDGKVDCADIALVKASFGKRFGDPGFNFDADVNTDFVVNISDLAIVSRQLPPGTQCQ